MDNLGKILKGGGIKINSSIHKNIHNMVRKSKPSKNQKVTVQDFITHLASNLENPTEGMGLVNTTPCIEQNGMDEVSNLQVAVYLVKLFCWYFSVYFFYGFRFIYFYMELPRLC